MIDWSNRSKEDVLEVLRHMGVSDETLEEIDAQLADPVDPTQAANVLLRYGITLDSVLSRMGGSP